MQLWRHCLACQWSSRCKGPEVACAWYTEQWRPVWLEQSEREAAVKVLIRPRLCRVCGPRRGLGLPHLAQWGPQVSSEQSGGGKQLDLDISGCSCPEVAAVLMLPTLGFRIPFSDSSL